MFDPTYNLARVPRYYEYTSQGGKVSQMLRRTAPAPSSLASTKHRGTPTWNLRPQSMGRGPYSCFMSNRWKIGIPEADSLSSRMWV